MLSFKGLKQLMAMIQGLVVLAALFMSMPAKAANESTVAKMKQLQAPTSPWFFDVNLETASNMMKDGTYEHEAQTNLEASVIYKFNHITKFILTSALYYEQTGAQNSGFDNTTVALSFASPLKKDITWTNSVAGVLPTNRQLQDATSFQGAVRAGSKLAISNLIWKSTLVTGLSLSRNFHEFDQTADGGANMRNTATGTLAYNLPLFSELSLSTTFNYTQGWTYQDDTRSKFYIGADLTWAFSPTLSGYIGTSNEGNAFKANGVDSNIDFFNDTSSVVKAGLNFSI